MDHTINQEDIDSELCNIVDDIDDSNKPTVCILHVLTGITDKEPKSSPSSKRIKKYEIPNPLPDKKSEKERQDAINSKRNRDKVKHKQMITENELAKCKDLIKNFEKELLLINAVHGKEIAELKMEIAQCKTEIVLRDKTISDLQHKVDFKDYLLGLEQKS